MSPENLTYQPDGGHYLGVGSCHGAGFQVSTFKCHNRRVEDSCLSLSHKNSTTLIKLEKILPLMALKPLRINV